jgi:general secretion pathway protein K
MTGRAKPGEHGAALLSVLLIVAVIAVLAVASLQKLRLATHLAGNANAIDQARAYAMAAETIARYRIGDLIQRDATRTTLQGNWADVDTPFPIDRGIATAQLSDGGNCFNLNSLVQDPERSGATVANGEAIAEFARLMTLLDTAPGEASRIATAAADWIDDDSTPLPGGAEDSAYVGGAPPYRTANTSMADVSELRVVAGVDRAVYARIAPYLCALPISDASPLNVNTLRPDRAALLAMLVPGLDVGRARAILAARPAAGYADLIAFWQHPGLAGAADAVKRRIGATTRWFGLRLTIELGDAELEEQALIDTATKPARLVRRRYGEPS